jgi:hypothetical protein
MEMKVNKFLVVTMILILAISLVGCQSDDKLEHSDVQGYAEPMSENILIAFSNGDYEGFIKDCSDTMLGQLTQEVFETQILPITDVIGKYQEGSKEFVTAKQVDKNFIQVVYNGEFSDEEGNVIVTITFNTDEDNRKIEGFVLNSPKLQKM